jgi:glycine cleavage system H protein
MPIINRADSADICSLFCFFTEYMMNPGENHMTDLKAPDDLKYTESDEWVQINGQLATIGLTDYAQNALNDIVYVELAEVGDSLGKGESFGTVESVKAASDMYTPVSGTVTETNQALEDEPELINADPYGSGWLLKIELDGESDLSNLMDSAAYLAYCADR